MDDPCSPCLESGMLNVLQVTDDNRVVLDTLLIMLECWNWAHRSRIQSQEQLWGQQWPMSSISLYGTPNNLKVTHYDREALNTLLILLDSLNLAHMFGDTYDHALLGHWLTKALAGTKTKRAYSSGKHLPRVNFWNVDFCNNPTHPGCTPSCYALLNYY